MLWQRGEGGDIRIRVPAEIRRTKSKPRQTSKQQSTLQAEPAHRDTTTTTITCPPSHLLVLIHVPETANVRMAAFIVDLEEGRGFLGVGEGASGAGAN